MTREQIDRICTWMGWHKNASGVLWRGPEDEERKLSYRAKVSDFDPSKNPSDCHTVMQEVRKRDCLVITTSDSDGATTYIKPNPGKFFRGDAETESEAKMNAVLAMIEGA